MQQSRALTLACCWVCARQRAVLFIPLLWGRQAYLRDGGLLTSFSPLCSPMPVWCKQLYHPGSGPAPSLLIRGLVLTFDCRCVTGKTFLPHNATSVELRTGGTNPSYGTESRNLSVLDNMSKTNKQKNTNKNPIKPPHKSTPDTDFPLTKITVLGKLV